MDNSSANISEDSKGLLPPPPIPPVVNESQQKSIKITKKQILILIGIFIVILFVVLCAIIFIISNNSTEESLEEQKSVPTPTYTPVPTASISAQPSISPTRIVTLLPSVTSTPSVTPTPAKNSVFGKYTNGRGENNSLPGQKVVIERVGGSERYESSSQPEWSFISIPPGVYKFTVASIPGYDTSIGFCYEGDSCYASDITVRTYTKEMEVRSDKILNVFVVYFQPGGNF